MEKSALCEEGTEVNCQPAPAPRDASRMPCAPVLYRSLVFHAACCDQERRGLYLVGREGGRVHAHGGGQVLPEVPVHRYHG